MSGNDYRIAVVERTLDLLEVLAAASTPLGVSQKSPEAAWVAPMITTRPPNSQALSPPARDRSTSSTAPESMIRRGRIVEVGD